VEAEREHKKRENIVREVERRLEELKQLDGEPHTKATCALRSHPVYGRCIRQTKGGKLNRARIRSEVHFDGKFLISTSDDTLSAEDAVMGYKQLAEIERVFRDLKHAIDIRPVFHRLPDRIKAHVLLCWLAMLLIRIAEQETDQAWQSILTTFQPLQMGICRTASGEVWQSSPVTKAQHELFTKLSLKLPPKYYKLPIPKSSQQ
jgi:transposase